MEPREPTRAELAREARECGYHAPRVTEVPTGALRVVRIDSTYAWCERRKSWYDRRGSHVEARIPDILRAFYDRALELKAQRAEAERREREREEEERRRRELKERREANAALIRRLEIQAGTWFRARMLRHYLRAMNAVAGEKPVDFIRWANQYVNQLDPLHPEPRHADMVPEENPYYRADEDELRESLARLTGHRWYRTAKLIADADATTNAENFDDDDDT